MGFLTYSYALMPFWLITLCGGFLIALHGSLQHETIHAFAELLGAMGYDHPAKINRRNVQRRMGDNVVKDFEDIFPSVPLGAFLDESQMDNWPGKFKRDFLRSNPDTFIGTSIEGDICETPA